MFKIIYIFTVMLLFSCEKKKVSLNPSQDKKDKEIIKNNILSDSCINNVAKDIESMKFRLVHDVVSTKDFAQNLNIENIDYAPGCGYLTLSADPYENIDYYKWKLCDQENCIEGELSWLPQVINHLKNESETLTLELKACVNNDAERVGLKQKQCLDSLQESEDIDSCLCSEKTVSQEVVQLSNIACSDDLRKAIEDYIHLTQNKIPDLTREYRSFLRTFIETYEGFSEEQKKQNHDFLPHYKAIKNLITGFSDEQLANYYTTHLQTLKDYMTSSYESQIEISTNLAGATGVVQCPYDKENIRQKISSSDHGIDTDAIVKNVSQSHAQKNDDADDFISEKRFIKGADPNLDTSYTGSNSTQNSSDPNSSDPNSTDPNSKNSLLSVDAKGSSLMIAGVPLIAVSFIGAAYGMGYKFGGKEAGLEDWNQKITNLTDSLKNYKEALDSSARNTASFEQFKKKVLQNFGEFENSNYKYTKSQFANSKQLKDLKNNITDFDPKSLDAAADARKGAIKMFDTSEFIHATNKGVYNKVLFGSAVIAAVGITLMIVGKQEGGLLSADFTRDFLEELKNYEDSFFRLIGEKNRLMKIIFSGA